MTRTASVSDRSGDVARHETRSLISSDKVTGTTVHDPSGNDLGTIHSVMIGKQDGKVGYAVLSFGGFLGIGHDYYPVPWDQLRYDTNLDGYVIGLTKETFERAPRYPGEAEWTRRDPAWAADVDRYYGGPTMI